MKATLLIDKSKINGDGLAPLYFRVRIPEGSRTLDVKLSTGLSVKPDDKIKGENQLKGNRKYNELIQKLEAIIHDIETDARLQEQPLTKEFIKSEFKLRSLQKPVEARLSYLELFEHIIEKNTGKYKTDYLRKYLTVKSSLLKFAKLKKITIDYEGLTEDFFNNYRVHLLTKKKPVTNTSVHNYFKALRQVQKEAKKQGIRLPYDLTEMKTKSDKTAPIWLTWEEVQILEKFKSNDSFKKRALHRFIFRCYTGLRESDLKMISKGNYVKENDKSYLRFHIVKQGTPNKILLAPKAIAILRLYGGRLPAMTQQNENRLIKEICKEAKINAPIQRVRRSGDKLMIENEPKHYFVAGHTARRSFARHWVEMGGSIHRLSKYLGHSSIDITTRYVGWSDQEVDQDIEKIFF